MIDYCISSFKEYNETLTYRVFETELLTGIARANGLEVKKNLLELIHPDDKPKVDPEIRAKEIITDIKKKLGERG